MVMHSIFHGTARYRAPRSVCSLSANHRVCPHSYLIFLSVCQALEHSLRVCSISLAPLRASLHSVLDQHFPSIHASKGSVHAYLLTARPIPEKMDLYQITHQLHKMEEVNMKIRNLKKHGKKAAAVLTAAMIAVSGTVPVSADSYLDSERAALDGLEKAVTKQQPVQNDSSPGGSVSLKLEIGETVRTLLTSLGGMDFSWLNSVELKTTAAATEDTFCSILFDLLVNNTDIVSLETPVDFANNLIKVRIPQLSESFLGISPTINGEDASLSLQDLINLEALNEALEEEETVVKILTRYAGIVLDSMAEGTSYDVSLGWGDVAEDLTVYEGILSEEGLYQAMENILSTAKDDEQLAQLIAQAENTVPQEDLYKEFQEAMEELLTQLQEVKTETEFDENNYISSKIMMDADEKCAGREITFYDEGELGAQLSWYSIEQGDDSAFRMLIDNGDQIWQLGGQGTTTNGKLSGSYTVNCDGSDMAKIEVTDYTADTENGGFSGDFRLTLPESDTGSEEAASSYAPALNVHIGQQLPDGWSGSISLTLADAPMASLDLHTSSDISMLPEYTGEETTYNIDNEEEASLFMSEITENAAVILENLKAAGMPEDFPEQVMQAAGNASSDETLTPQTEE